MPPFFLNAGDPAAILMQERSHMFAEQLVASQVPKAMGPSGGNWRPPMNPNQMYNLLAASAACSPWYLAALAAESSGFRSSSFPPAGQTTTTSTTALHPHLPVSSSGGPPPAGLWPPANALPSGLSFSDLMRQSISGASVGFMSPRMDSSSRRPSPPPPASSVRYTPYSVISRDGPKAATSPLTTSSSIRTSIEK